MRSPIPRPALGLALLAATLAVAGCGKGTTSTGPNAPMTQDVADDFALNTAAALTVVGGDVEAAGTASTGSAAVLPQGARLGAAQWDTTFVRNGITFEASRTFYDAIGNVLPGFGPTAAKLVWTSRAFGTWEGTRDTLTVGHDASLAVTGNHVLALADTLLFNGASDDTLTNRFRSYDGTRTRYFHWVSSLAITDVHWPKGASYPASGTATFTVSADRLRSNDVRDVESHWNVTVVVTFNGTATPDLVVNGTWHYHWNLLTGQVTRA